MSRYSTRQPFSTAAAYKAARRILINGKYYSPGDVVPGDAAPDRIMAALYDQRKIDMMPLPASQEDIDTALEQLAEAKAKEAAASIQAQKDAPKPPSKPRAKPKPKPAPAATTEPENDLPGGWKVSRVGMGGWKVLNPDGIAVGESHPTEEEARAEATRLHGESVT